MKMQNQSFVPVLELQRGELVESVHLGALAIVDAQGHLLASLGDPYHVAFLRSSAKPFQLLPFVERGGPQHFGLTPQEIAIACASHETARAHLETVATFQAKVGIRESDLQCSPHLPGDPDMLRQVLCHNVVPTPNFNNCSGKHTAMLAHARMRGLPLETYLSPDHPIQRDILMALAEMSDLSPDQIALGVDGCSAPNFALPLYHAALATARLCDPRHLPERRAQACRMITAAMLAHPEMISGPGEFDCELMRVGEGRWIAKRGAEGFQVVGLMPGVIGEYGAGIALKIADGDLSTRDERLVPRSRVRPAVILEVLRQIGVLDSLTLSRLQEFGPQRILKNHAGLVTGRSYPVFSLNLHSVLSRL